METYNIEYRWSQIKEIIGDDVEQESESYITLTMAKKLTIALVSAIVGVIIGYMISQPQ